MPKNLIPLFSRLQAFAVLALLAACALGTGATQPESYRPVEATAPSPPSEPTRRGPIDAGVDPARQASVCLADLACPSSEAARLLLAAADAQDPELDCFRLLDGGLTPRDAVRGRECLERSTGSTRCNGSAMDLAVAELAVMRIDGAGGKADLAGGRALVADCMDDVVKAEVVKHAAAVERDPKTTPMAFCQQVSGTTLTTDICRARTRDTVEERVQIAAKTVFATLDERGKRLFSDAHQAHKSYVTSMAYFASTRYEAVSTRGAIALVLSTRLLESRGVELSAFQAIGAMEASKDDVDRGTALQAAAIAKLRLVVPREKNAFRQTELKWSAYEKAEHALYDHVFSAQRTSTKVRAAVTAYLAERRARDVQP